MPLAVNFATKSNGEFLEPHANRSGNQHHGPGINVVLGFLVFICSASLVFGTVKFYYDIRAPFQGRNEAEDAESFLAKGVSAGSNDDALKSLDSDKDGLSDYDEITFHHTSAYVADSDSDGIDDAKEVKKGTDPNCAEGKDCLQSNPKQSESNTEGLESLGGVSESQNLANLSAEQIRTLLIKQGISEGELANVDDLALVEMYRKILSDETGRVQNTKVDTSNPSLKNPDEMTATEIRSLLLGTGKFTQTQLQELDDETLKAAYVKAYQGSGN